MRRRRASCSHPAQPSAPCKRRGIHIGWTRCDAVPTQQMDSQLMEQALLNIVKNALEAVEASGQEGGYIPSRASGWSSCARC
jgi:C4-dicarboxylate-specific signal transduction histidine kinase